MGRELGFSVVTHDLLQEEGEVVSSTRIRGLLRAGRVEAAARLLGRCHVVRGHVQHGRGEGTGMGFPTANVACDGRDCMPGEGVYGGWVVVGDAAWPAAINVGAPVSFDARERLSFLEANLMGFEGDLYGCDVAVVFAAWLRGARRFESVEELERVVGGNIAWVREHLGEGRVALDDVGARAGAAAGAGADADAAAGAGLWAFQPPATHVNPAES
jgi:riboflavin kinase/FMN adenylyltransferase